MSQAWLQVVGLILDFAGFALIAWEWILSQRAERALLAIELQRARSAESRSHLQKVASDPAMQRHLESVGELERRRAERAADASRELFARRRYGAIYFGMMLVVAGFILQLLAAWPGCCRAIGIEPLM